MRCPRCGHEWRLMRSDREPFPVRVSCFGRKYLASTQHEFEQLMSFLIDGRKALANRFRVGGRWIPAAKVQE